jgi:DNA-binding protein WhiA
MDVSFSSGVKKELSAHFGGGRHCDLAELAAILNTCGDLRGGLVTVRTENISLAKKCFTLIKKNFRISSKLSVTQNKQLGKGHLYSLAVADPERACVLLTALGILHKNPEGFSVKKRVDPNVVKRVCCMRSYLRGAFLAGGSLTNPEKTYHMEFVTPQENLARKLRRLLAHFKIKGRIIVRKGHYVVYLKGAESIVDLLNVMGAHVSLLTLENVRIVKFTRNQVNRMVNCETANIHKTVVSALSQMESIHLIERMAGLDTLPRPLLEAARLRLQFPEASLKEIGAMMSPPVGKSGVNHRLRKVGQIAERLRTVEQCRQGEKNYD